jgi:hypothetical protein
MLPGGGPLPAAFDLEIGLSNFLQCRFWVIMPLTIVFLVLDPRLYRFLFRRFGSLAASLWSLGLSGAVIVCLVVACYSLAEVAYSLGQATFPPVKQTPSPLASPSGQYGVYPAPSKVDTGFFQYTAVQLHLTDPAGKELTDVVTSISHEIQWMVGWMPDEDIVVLMSSGIDPTGYAAYSIANGKFEPILPLTETMRQRARELKAAKYGLPHR